MVWGGSFQGGGGGCPFFLVRGGFRVKLLQDPKTQLAGGGPRRVVGRAANAGGLRMTDQARENNPRAPFKEGFQDPV